MVIMKNGLLDYMGYRNMILEDKIRECLDVLYRASNVYFDNSLPKTEIVPCRYGSETNQVGAYFNYMDAMGR